MPDERSLSGCSARGDKFGALMHRLRMRPTSRIAVGFLTLVAVAFVAGCSGVPKGSERTLRELSHVAALHVSPPKAAFLGSGEDRGSNSIVDGRPPQISSAFASSLNVDLVSSYYQKTYPNYRLRVAHPRSLMSTQLIGHDGAALVIVDIDPERPHISSYIRIKLKHVSEPECYVVVSAQGPAS